MSLDKTKPQENTPTHSSRRHILKLIAAASVTLPQFIDQALAQEQSDTNEEYAYSQLSAAEEEKVVRYTTMIQGLFKASPKLNRLLHPESKLDYSEQQQALFKTDLPLEFGPGFLYHGDGNLKNILLQSTLDENAYLTRTPQTWALQPFVDSEEDPAIFMIDALDFNRWRDEGDAEWKAEKFNLSNGGKCIEPYPWIKNKTPLESISRIIISKTTYDKFKKLSQQQAESPQELTLEEQKIIQVFTSLDTQGKITYFKDEVSKDLVGVEPHKRFLGLFLEIETYLKLYGLNQQMPRFQVKNKTSTANKKTKQPISHEEALGKLIEKAKQKQEEEQKRQQEMSEKAEQHKKLPWIVGGTILGTAGLGYFGISKFIDGLSKAKKEDEKQQT